MTKVVSTRRALRLPARLLVPSLWLVTSACGDGGGHPGTDARCFCYLGDADYGDGRRPGDCNPVSQMGCDVGEKCAQIVESLEPFLARTTCVPDGQKKAGEACEGGEPGPMGYDDCAAGLACNGICVGICSLGPPEQKPNCQTPEDESCALYPNTFNDVGNMDVGLCTSACDPVTQKRLIGGESSNEDCPLVGDRQPACYLSSALGISSCLAVPDAMPGNDSYEPLDRATRGQDRECYSVDGTPCLVNACAAGYGQVLENPEGGSQPWCAAWCRPIDTYVNADFSDWDVTDDDPANAAKGDLNSGLGCSTNKTSAAGGSEAASTNHDCRFINGLYSNTSLTPDAYGACIPLNTSTDYGACAPWDFDLWLLKQSQQRPDMSPNPCFKEHYCTNDDWLPDAEVNFARCPRGCMGFTVLEALYEDEARVWPEEADCPADPPVTATEGSVAAPTVIKGKTVSPAEGFMDPKLLENFGKLQIQAAEK